MWIAVIEQALMDATRIVPRKMSRESWRQEILEIKQEAIDWFDETDLKAEKNKTVSCIDSEYSDLDAVCDLAGLPKRLVKAHARVEIKKAAKAQEKEDAGP